jgi:hypothetical protein
MPIPFSWIYQIVPIPHRAGVGPGTLRLQVSAGSNCSPKRRISSTPPSECSSGQAPAGRTRGLE